MTTKINTIDWSSKDDYKNNGAYFVIQTFGRDENNDSYHLQINGFEPYFYVRNVNNISKEDFIDSLETLSNNDNSFFDDIVRKSIQIAKEKNYNFLRNGQSIQGKVSEYKKFYSIEVLWDYFEIENKKIFYYYQENEEQFFKLKFRSKRAFTLMKKMINEYTEYELFETNIDPLIRFFHDKNIDPCGWIEVENEYQLNCMVYGKDTDEPVSECAYSKGCNIKYVSRCEKSDIAKFLVASFDIECTSETGEFPNANKPNDKIIQIGTTFHYYGDKEPKIHTMVTLDPCEDIEGLDSDTLKVVNNEIELLEEWKKIIIEYDPDIITGYNIWGFDFKYMYDRYKYLKTIELSEFIENPKELDEDLEKDINEFWQFSRLKKDICRFQRKDLSSSALGDNKLYYFETKGRVQIDLLKLAQKDYNLDSYKLDNVSSTFLQGTVENLTGNTFTSNSVDGLFVGNQVSFIDIDGDKIEDGKKYTIKNISENNITINENIEDIYKKAKIDKLEEKKNEMPDKENFDESKIKYKLTWCENKIDLPPNKIFENFRESQKEVYNEKLQKLMKQSDNTDAGRKMKEIAVYCIKDCVLCNTLMIKLDVITKNIGMANVCCVPLSYLFLRGQGVKIFSVISKYTKLDNYIIPLITKDDINNVSYEGAIVFPPKEGGLLSRNPVAVMDYSSLYPSCMISDNISHDSLIAVYDTDLDGNNPEELRVKDKLYNKYNKNSDKYPYEKLQESIKTGEINKIEYDNIENGEKIGKRQCYYQWNNGQKKGILPKVLNELLQARKRTRKTQKQYDSSNFMWGVLEGLQLAYKVTCNSVYGQMGASTSALCIKELAASTTAKGRELLTIGKDLVINRELYPKDYLLELNKKIIEENPKEDASEFINNDNEFKCVYGDTDSVFIDFETSNLEEAIRLGLQGGRLVTEELVKQNRGNHELEYEKTFYPLVLFTKKRYIGMKYEFDTNKGKLTSMGVVLKRRDNAKILKDIYQGVIDCIMDNKEKDYIKTYYLHNLKRLFAGNMNMNKLIITKTLRSNYKNPNQIAHKVLADRMDRRNPGEGPQSNDRVPYVYIDTNTVECYKCKGNNSNKYKCIGCQQLYCEKCINKDPIKDQKNKNQTSKNTFSFVTGKVISKEENKNIYECHECKNICRECKVELKKKNEKEDKIDKDKCYKCKKTIKNKDFKDKEEYNCNICDENFCEKCLKYHSDEYEHKCGTCNGVFCHKCLRKHKDKYPENNCKNIIERVRDENNKLDPSKSYKCEKLLQGDKIEHPDYIHDNKNLKPDFHYYYEHQIETPVGQIFDLLLDKKDRELFDKEINDLIKNL